MLANNLLDLFNRIFKQNGIEDAVDLLIVFSISEKYWGEVRIQRPKSIVLCSI